MHEVVEALAALEEVVDTTQNAEDTEGEDPDTDDGDNGGLTTNEPTEDTEEGGDDVDDENSTAKLPRRDGGPERTVGTGDEDEPVLGQGDLEEENLVTDTKVLDDTTADTLTGSVGKVLVGEHGGESDPGADGENAAEKDGHAPKLGQVPLDGGLGERGVVVSNSQSSNVSENGDEDDELEVEGGVEDGDPETQEDFQVKRQGNTVDNVCVHAVENLAGGLESVNDGRKTGSKEDNIGGGASSIGCTLDSDTSVSLLERGSVVDTVTSHGHEVATLLKNLDDVVLVLGEDLSETIGSLDEVIDLGTRHLTTATETKTLSVVDVRSETELAGSLTSDTDGVTSQHLDGQTKSLGFVDGTGGIVTRRVRARHDTEDLPRVISALAGNTKRTETTGSKLGDLVLVGLIDIGGDGVVLFDGLEDEERSSLDADDALALRRLDDGLDLLGDGVEGVEVEDLVLGEDVLCAWVVLERLQESLVNGIDTLLLAGGSETGSKHEILGVNASNAVGLCERELVLGEGTGLVGAKDFDTSERLDGGELLNNGLLLGEVSGTDSHGGGDDSWETDGDTNDGDGEGELEDGHDAVGSVERGDPNDEESDNDENQQNGTDAVEHLREVTSAGGGRGDERSSATDEGRVTGGSDDHEGLTTLDGRGSVAGVALVLVDSKGLTSDGGLIDLEEAVFGDETTIGGDDGAFLDLEDITGDDFRSFNLSELAVTEDGSLESERLLQFLDNGTSLVFLDETDSCVKQQEGANDTEINPILFEQQLIFCFSRRVRE